MSMISKQVDEIRHAARVYNHYPLLAKMLNGAADTITLLSEKLRAANMERSAAHYNDGWIPCSERLPDSSYGSVLIYTKEGGVAEGQYYNTIKAWKQFRWSVEDAEVIAWRPFPEPYKGSEV